MHWTTYWTTEARRWLGIPIAALLIVALGGGPAEARDVDQLRAAMNAAREQLAQLSTNEFASAAALEMERARIDIDEATESIGARQPARAEVAVIRLENRIKLIEAQIFQATVESQADQRESSAIEMTREADQAQVSYEATDARRAALRNETAEILRQLEMGE